MLYTNEKNNNGRLLNVYAKFIEKDDSREQILGDTYTQYVYLSKGDKIQLIKGFIIPLNKSKDLEVLNCGSYVVGIHINPGKYIATTDEKALIIIYDRKTNSMLEKYKLEKDGLINSDNAEFTLTKGQYVYISGCILTEK